MPATLTALGVVVLAVLPGAVWMFAFESRVGPYKVSAPDRLVRFLAASAVFHALAAGLTYHLYQTQVRPGHLEQGDVSVWAVQVTALAYILIPYAAGRIVGNAYAKNWRLTRLLFGSALYPRAWDYIFSQDRPGYILLRLKSDRWLAGLFATGNAPGAYASGYGEEADLYLSPSVEVDPRTGEIQLDEEDRPKSSGSGILVRWNEVQYAKFFFVGDDNAKEGD